MGPGASPWAQGSWWHYSPSLSQPVSSFCHILTPSSPPLLKDMLSILDPPASFNNDDFEIPIYPSFNEWTGRDIHIAMYTPLLPPPPSPPTCLSLPLRSYDVASLVFLPHTFTHAITAPFKVALSCPAHHVLLDQRSWLTTRAGQPRSGQKRPLSHCQGHCRIYFASTAWSQPMML